MPKNEEFWNPYRMVPVRETEPLRKAPYTHEKFHGLSGEIKAKLTTLTPFLIGVNEGNVKKHIHSNLLPILPGSSLKGMLRSLAELVGNGCDVTESTDTTHSKCQAHDKLCICCRMFGMQHKQVSFMGKVSCGEGRWEGEERPRDLKQQRVLLASPKDKHIAFYTASKNVRKVYHHNSTCKDGPQQNHNSERESMVAYLHPLAADETFSLQIKFSNLEEDEFALLLYCLALERNISVEVNGSSYSGDLYHKLGMGKPIGMGSVKIDITRLTLQDNASGYRTWVRPDQDVFEGSDLHRELKSRTAALRADNSPTMNHLRSILFWLPEEKRTFRYPDPDWFNKNSQVKLKNPSTGK